MIRDYVVGIVQGKFKNGKTHSTSARVARNSMTATVTNGGTKWGRNPNGMGYVAMALNTRTTAVIVMGTDGDCKIEVQRDGVILYVVDIAPEHLSAVEENMPTVTIVKKP